MLGNYNTFNLHIFSSRQWSSGESCDILSVPVPDDRMRKQKRSPSARVSVYCPIILFAIVLVTSLLLQQNARVKALIKESG